MLRLRRLAKKLYISTGYAKKIPSFILKVVKPLGVTVERTYYLDYEQTVSPGFSRSGQ